MSLPSLSQSEQVKVADASFRVLAEAATAASDLPPFPASLRDGFACRAGDISGAAGPVPVVLRVVARIGAGMSFRGSLLPGEAVRLMTGAPLPAGADTVVPLEAAATEGSRVLIKQPPAEGENIAAAGSDISRGRILLSAGTLITPGHVGLLAASGRATVVVYRRPRVAVLSCGTELTPPGTPLTFGRIYESNSAMTAALAVHCGAEVTYCNIVPDCPRRLSAALARALDGADAVVTTGGVAGGDYDLTPAAVLSLGAETIFDRVALVPGGRMLAALLEKKTIFCLTGKPAGAWVTFQLFVRPALFRLQGRAEAAWRTVEARPINVPGNNRDLELCLPAVVYGERGELVATPARRGEKSGLLTLGAANALLILPAGAAAPEPGKLVTVLQI